MSKKTKALSLESGMHFTSFEELGKVCGRRPVIKQTRDKEKLGKQREDFCKRHICSACGKPMVFISGTNAMVCTNQECNGVKTEVVNQKTGETVTRYSASYHTLDDKGAEIAENIFAEVV